MPEFISANAGTIAVGFVVFAVAAAIVFKLIQDKRKGKLPGCSCGCGACGGCPKSAKG